LSPAVEERDQVERVLQPQGRPREGRTAAARNAAARPGSKIASLRELQVISPGTVKGLSPVTVPFIHHTTVGCVVNGSRAGGRYRPRVVGDCPAPASTWPSSSSSSSTSSRASDRRLRLRAHTLEPLLRRGRGRRPGARAGCVPRGRRPADGRRSARAVGFRRCRAGAGRAGHATTPDRRGRDLGGRLAAATAAALGPRIGAMPTAPCARAPTRRARETH